MTEPTPAPAPPPGPCPKCGGTRLAWQGHGYEPELRCVSCGDKAPLPWTTPAPPPDAAAVLKELSFTGSMKWPDVLTAIARADALIRHQQAELAALREQHGPGKCARMGPHTVRPVYPLSEDDQ